MEEQNTTGNIGDPETISPSPSAPVSDVHDEAVAAVRDSVAVEEKGPPLTKRLSEAFREGMASAGPEGKTKTAVKIPPRPREDRPEERGEGVLKKVIQGGGSVVAGVGDAAAGALSAFVQFVKKTPDLTQKYAEAFRAGAASVKPRDGVNQRETAGPAAAKQKQTPTDGREILHRLWQVGEAATGFVREAVSVVNPGEVVGARQKIRVAQKKINQLYIDIGSEAANSWSDGLLETEKLATLLDELRRKEEEILSVEAHLAQVAAAGKTEAARKSPTATQRKASAPADGNEVSPVAASDETEESPDQQQKDGSAPVDNLPGVFPVGADSVAAVEPGAEPGAETGAETSASLLTPEGAPEDAPEGAQESATDGVPEGTPEYAPEGVPEGAPEDAPEDAPEGAQESATDGASDGVPEDALEDVSKGVMEDAPDNVPEGATESLPENVVITEAASMAESEAEPAIEPAAAMSSLPAESGQEGSGSEADPAGSVRG